MMRIFVILFVFLLTGCAGVESKEVNDKVVVPYHLLDVDLDILHNKCVSMGYEAGSEKYNQCIETKDNKNRGK